MGTESLSLALVARFFGGRLRLEGDEHKRQKKVVEESSNMTQTSRRRTDSR